MSEFWKNLEELRKIHLLSIDGLCRELEKASREDGGEPIHMTKAQYYHRLKKAPDSEPSERLDNLVKKLYCSCSDADMRRKKWSLGEARACHGLSRTDVMVCLATHAEVLRYPEDPVRIFWKNYELIEEFHEAYVGYKPWWPHASQYFFKLLRTRDRLPPLPVIRDIAERFGIRLYPLLYLQRLKPLYFAYDSIFETLDKERDNKLSLGLGVQNRLLRKLTGLQMKLDELLQSIDEMENFIQKEFPGRDDEKDLWMQRVSAMMKSMTLQAGCFLTRQDEKRIVETCRMLREVGKRLSAVQDEEQSAKEN